MPLRSLFQIRDRYLQLHQHVFAGPGTVMLRLLRLRKNPDYRQLSVYLLELRAAVDGIMPSLTRLANSGVSATRHVDRYGSLLMTAIASLQALLAETAAVGSPARVSNSSLARYQAAAADFGALTHELRASMHVGEQITRPPKAMGPSERLAMDEHELMAQIAKTVGRSERDLRVKEEGTTLTITLLDVSSMITLVELTRLRRPAVGLNPWQAGWNLDRVAVTPKLTKKLGSLLSAAGYSYESRGYQGLAIFVRDSGD